MCKCRDVKIDIRLPNLRDKSKTPNACQTSKYENDYIIMSG